MRVHLKGLNQITKTLASGRRKTYYYAYKGGPRLKGKPGDAEFMSSFTQAHADRRPQVSHRCLHHLADEFMQSMEFRRLAWRTQSDYRGIIRRILDEFGDAPVEDLADKAARSEFMSWRDKLAEKSPRQADYAWTVLARLLAWAVDRGLAPTNPCKRGGRLYKATRVDCVWSDEQIASLEGQLPKPLALALTLALWTGQRQGDLLNLTWGAYDGTFLRLRQGKTGVRVTIPVGAPLKKLLDEERGSCSASDPIMRNTQGEAWSPGGFRCSWRKACRLEGIAGLTFHDLRGTAVLRLSLASCTEAEIATITGHSLRDVRSILDANYFHRDVRLGISAIAKLEAHQPVNPGSNST